jgi:excinuclease ABC subunit A
MSKKHSEISIKGARTNNLKGISLCIPHNKFIVVTGISGSGKSSLAFDVIAKEGQRRYFETLPSFSRQFLGKINRPEIDSIEGLSPVIAIGQRTSGMHSRSTVGTLTDIYDLLRLLFARIGVTTEDVQISRALFSFNSEVGKCKRCNGIGKEEEIDLSKLIVNSNKTIREGALAPTLPNGYIMYSQVTIDVLNQVCEAEGFSVDISWNKLSNHQRNVILNGSEKIKVPFGKHSLESRLKWTGIKAKPREEGYYKGMIPIMSDILKRDRNANILKYVHAITCTACNGTRLNHDALSVKVHSKNIADTNSLEINNLTKWLSSNTWDPVAQKIVTKISAQTALLEDLGLGHLNLDRPSNTLRSSEIQRLRLANQFLMPLSNVLYVFDEPSIGLHPTENQRMIHHFKSLVQKGNTVIVVEHDLKTVHAADHIIEIGPKAGLNGGQLIFNGSLNSFKNAKDLLEISPTYKALQSNEDIELTSPNKLDSKKSDNAIELLGCKERNLKNINVEFKLGKLNVVSGRSGSGKSSLVRGTLLPVVQNQLGIQPAMHPKLEGAKNIELLNKLILVDHSPIGKTPRSNAATYLGISDHIRDLYAQLPSSKEKGFTKSRFSFNNKGGRCETCQGAGKTQIGMHFLGNIDLVCGICGGQRFNSETLAISYKGYSIADCYQLSVNEAVDFFSDQQKIIKGLKILQDIGLGYLTLGQSSTTLSGGEAQRIKIANQLQKKDTGDTLFIIIEPSIGLHSIDIQSLLKLFTRITKSGNTVVCIEQDEKVISSSDWHIEIGPDSGTNGGAIIHQGKPSKNYQEPLKVSVKSTDLKVLKEIQLKGVRTHQLKNINITIPKNALTVVTGVSGSGKSSLVYDTLFAESNARFTESLATYNRTFIQQNNRAVLDSFSGLGPSIGINRSVSTASKRSTVGTLSGIYDALRLLYSRISQENGSSFSSQHFSFNHHLGACLGCNGLGVKRKCDPDNIIISTSSPLFKGAISSNNALRYYADLNGQFIATLKEVAKQRKWDLEPPWDDLDSDIQNTILYGTGQTVWKVKWEYKTKTRSGVQAIQAKWLGFCNYIDSEYQRKLHNKNIKALEDFMHDVKCSTCDGSRLKPQLLEIKFNGKNIFELVNMPITVCYDLLINYKKDTQAKDSISEIAKVVLPGMINSLKTLIDLGLGYLNLDRAVNSLSGGERQRVTLASQLSANLFGVTYVLDEPTIGLDDAQIGFLSKSLKKIINQGSTVVVVEHDPIFIKTADYLIEMGPGAGVHGGNVVYQGAIENISSVKDSITYKMLDAQGQGLERSKNVKGLPFGLKEAKANNLKSIDVEFYTGQITAITGVSGSGKSSLIRDVLFKSWMKDKNINCSSTYGLKQFEEILFIDQKELNQSRLATTVSYTGIIDSIKAIFAKTNDAKNAGLKKADFSYQSKRGKCVACKGQGQLKTSLDFMSDLWLDCDTCNGTRYNKQVLECKIKSHSIGNILQMSVLEAMQFFKDERTLMSKLTLLEELGLSHLRLGQAGNTLSGGELQRLKLAKSMLRKQNGATLYLFDEPSTGLHYFDVLRLTSVFQSIIDQGDTIIIIEHNKALIEAADRIIKLGPGSGEKGGEVIY